MIAEMEIKMFIKKYFHGIAVFTLSAFICFTLTLEYSFAQEENPLLKAQGLYKQGNLIEAVKVLEAFIDKASGSRDEQKRLAEAYFLLARIYYDAGEDARVMDYLKLAVAADADIGRDEGNIDLKARLERVREDWLKVQPQKTEPLRTVPTETNKASSQSNNNQIKVREETLQKYNLDELNKKISRAKSTRTLGTVFTFLFGASSIFFGLDYLLGKDKNGYYWRSGILGFEGEGFPALISMGSVLFAVMGILLWSSGQRRLNKRRNEKSKLMLGFDFNPQSKRAAIGFSLSFR